MKPNTICEAQMDNGKDTKNSRYWGMLISIERTAFVADKAASNDGLIDELSLLIIPLAEGTPKTPTTFEVSEYLKKNPATELKLKEVQQLRNDVLWLKYAF